MLRIRLFSKRCPACGRHYAWKRCAKCDGDGCDICDDSGRVQVCACDGCYP